MLLVITGAQGNIGWKYLEHYSRHGRGFARVVGIDRTPISEERQAQLAVWGAANPHGAPATHMVVAELSDATDARWTAVVAKADVLLHLAAVNPFPGATWTDATQSFDMAASVFLVAARASRVVYASTNHVMGAYLQADLAPGRLTPALPPGPGTVWHTGQTPMDSTVYAAGKWAGERLNHMLSVHSDGRRTAVSLRIGWVQPGENVPATLSATGTPFETPDPARPPSARDARWFRGLWLSNHDLVQVLDAALVADASAWPAPHVIVHAVSHNTESPWSNAECASLLGYDPVDSVDDPIAP
jgi:nucleoside-diphosphate-sugar epimerase